MIILTLQDLGTSYLDITMLIIHVPIIQNFTQHSPYFFLSYGSHRTHKTHLLIFIKHPKFIKSSHPNIIHTLVKHGTLLGALWSLNIFLFSCLDCAILFLTRTDAHFDIIVHGTQTCEKQVLSR
ncbi:hypothetical protein HanPI659440_Chr15g0602051 [Helianthus annuus]|nr:hypothetical protein HanPI659440_Chr15g0602051 [Helianthus annuus]